jgi:hypothetical protein
MPAPVNTVTRRAAAINTSTLATELVSSLIMYEK